MRSSWPKKGWGGGGGGGGKGLGLRIWGLGFRLEGFGFRVSGFGFRVSGFGFRVHILEPRGICSLWVTRDGLESSCPNSQQMVVSNAVLGPSITKTQKPFKNPNSYFPNPETRKTELLTSPPRPLAPEVLFTLNQQKTMGWSSTKLKNNPKPLYTLNPKP